MVVALVISGCPKPGDKPPTALPQTGLFQHDTHLAEGLKCEACHFADPKKQYALLRPGAQAHAPCDGCHEHEREFYEKPDEFCEVCHESVDPLHEGRSPLHPYPRRQNTAQLVASFNHEQHLAPATAERSGSGLDCGDCHQVPSPDAAYASFPRHQTCGKCHAEAVAPRMSDCRGCHEKDGPGHGRRFLKHLENDVRFTHGKHMVAPTGEKVECRYCHEDVDSSDRAEDLNLPEMRVCASCHESELTPVDKRMKNCGLCHTGDVSSEPLPGNHTAEADVGPLRWRRTARSRTRVVREPTARSGVRSRRVRRGRGCGEHEGSVRAAKPNFTFLELPSLLKVVATATTGTSTPTADEPPPKEKPKAFPKTTGVFSRPKPPKKRSSVAPQDHTPIFRRRHARAAESDGAACNYCHLGVSGSTRDACQDCHAVTRPRSHTLRFRTVGHGRLSARDPKACATCHEIDYCTECHNVAPQSHFPLRAFRARHSRPARVNPRSCMTCHTFEATCVRCHSLDLTIAPRNVSGLRRR